MNRTYANAELIQKARSGDQSAITDLYQQTYDQAYHTVRSMIRDEDEVLDILQDSYMKVFTHLDSFEGDKFTAKDLGVSSVAVDSRMTGGIILESEDGTIQIDMQYKTLLQTLWDREMKSLSDILFG